MGLYNPLNPDLANGEGEGETEGEGVVEILFKLLDWRLLILRAPLPISNTNPAVRITKKISTTNNP